MIREVIFVEDYWKIIVYYNIDYNLFNYIAKDFYSIGTSYKTVNRIYKIMKSYKAKGVTLSNKDKHISVVAFNKHKTRLDYINSIVHEAEHVKQAMLKAYKVDDTGEPPAYTIGFLVMKMLESKIFKNG